MTTKSREAFEAWWKPTHQTPCDNWYGEVRDGWSAWKAAETYGRKQALEDVANGFIKQKSWTQDMAHAVVQHAADEGALK